MSKTVRLPWPIASLTFHGGLTVRFPLTEPEAFSLGPSAPALALDFDAALAEHAMEWGLYSTLLQHIHRGELEKLEVTVPFRRSRDGSLFPDLKLGFDAFHTLLPDGSHLAFVPALGIQALAESMEALYESIVEAVRLEFLRKDRLASVHRLLATQWFEKGEVEIQHTETKVYTPAELRDLRKVKKLLLDVAEPLSGSDFGPTFGLEEELNALLRAVEGEFAESVLLIGPSGVGKTALVHAFNRERMDHPGLRSREVWETTASRLLQGLMDPMDLTGWQHNLAQVCRELRDNGGFLYVRNLADLFDVGRSVHNTVSMGEFLRGPLERGEVRVIGECTDEEAAILETRYPGYLQAFRPIRLEQPTGSRLRDIVSRRVRSTAGSLPVTDEAIDAAINLHRRFTPYSGFPGKPIRSLERLVERVSALAADGVDTRAHGGGPGEVSRLPAHGEDGEPTVTASRVVASFCEETGMPNFLVDPRSPLPPGAIEEHFRSRIFGQDEGVRAVVDAVAAVKSALGRGGRPMASLLFAGPTGVGKTEAAKALAELLFGRRDRLLRFDMSEYADVEAVLRLTGEAGASRDGALTGAVRRHPFSVVLFDEIEKAHPAFDDLLLQVLDAGRLTDGRGRVADFCSTVIIMTSNVGAESLSRGSLGLGSGEGAAGLALAHFARAVESHFRPELYNRFDRVVCFAPLDPASIRSVVDREVRSVQRRTGLRDRDVPLKIQEEAHQQLALLGYDQQYGARQVQRAVRDHLVGPLSRALAVEPRVASLEAVVTKGDGSLEIQILRRASQRRPDPKPGLDGLVGSVTEWRRFLHALEDGSDYQWLEGTLARLRKKKSLALSSLSSRDGGPKAMDPDVLEREVDAFKGLFPRCEDLEARVMGQLLAETGSGGQGRDADAAEGVNRELGDELRALRRDAWPHVAWLYRFADEKSRKAVLGLYGQLPHALRALADHYLAAAEGEKLSARTREVRLLPGSGAGRRSMVVLQEGQAKEGDGSLLVGIEIEISGPAAGLLLVGEEGLYEWASEGKTERLAVLAAGGKDFDSFQRPPEVHRKSFFQRGRILRKYWEKRDTVGFCEDPEAPPKSLRPLHELPLLLRRRRLSAVTKHFSRGRASPDLLFPPQG